MFLLPLEVVNLEALELSMVGNASIWYGLELCIIAFADQRKFLESRTEYSSRSWCEAIAGLKCVT